MSDSGSPHGGEYKLFRQISRDRLLNEMLGSIKAGESKPSWKVLIMDKITVKIMSYSCKMADITNAGIPLVEDLCKRRQPLPSMEAVYFIQPLKENISIFLSDMSGRCPLYKKAYVFFSSPVAKDLLAGIKNDTSVLPRIGALREMNLEYFPIDNQGYITDDEWALEVLFRENMEGSHKFDACLNAMASRAATVFASMKEFPYVRYRAAISRDASTLTTVHDLIPTKFAATLWNCLEKYRSTIPQFPNSETCELLIVDRSIDQIAPVIHEWTYGAMCHDLLNMEGNKYVHEVTAQGKTEKKEVLLEDHDPIWVELRDLHFADASERLHTRMQNFISKNKAAQIRHNTREGDDLSTRDLQKMVQALPQYSEQIDKLTLHVDIAQKLNEKIRQSELQDVGHLEEDLVFGHAGAKEVIQFLRVKQDTASAELKLRLLMIYASIYPEKFEGDKGAKLMQLARLSPDDMKAVTNMRFLGSSDSKKTSGGKFSLKFDTNKKHAARKERANEQEQWQLSKFYPMVEDLIRQLSKGELPKDEFPCMNHPSPTCHGSPSPSVDTDQSQPVSVRSRRSATWAKPRQSDDGSSDSILRHGSSGSSDFKKMGQRIFVFIIGGATRSELRAAHKLTNELNREIVLGSSSIVDPLQFITKIKLLSAPELLLDG